MKKDSVILEWQSPEDDGGLDLIKYTIEKCDPQSSIWMKVAEIEPNENSFSIQKLLENSEYMFRITAENPIGISDPAESEIITTKKKLGNF